MVQQTICQSIGSLTQFLPIIYCVLACILSQNLEEKTSLLQLVIICKGLKDLQYSAVGSTKKRKDCFLIPKEVIV